MNASYLLYAAMNAEPTIERKRREAHYIAQLEHKLSKPPKSAKRTKRLRGLVAKLGKS